MDSSYISYTSYIGRATEPTWTAARVEDRLRKAVALKAVLVDRDVVDVPPMERRPDGIGIIGGIGVASAGTTEDGVVAAAAEALSWLRWLDPDDAGIVNARLEGASWKIICWHYDISRPTADRHWRYALAIIAWRLNGNARSRRTPSLRSLLGMRRAA